MDSIVRSYPDSRSAKILVAEDHADSREAMRTLLEAFGYVPVIATTGAEAVDRALAERPDLILMDVMMPEMDGIEAVRRLRAEAATVSTPIILVTAMDGAPERGLAAGANDFLRKPVDFRLLLAKVRAWLHPDAR